MNSFIHCVVGTSWSGHNPITLPTYRVEDQFTPEITMPMQLSLKHMTLDCVEGRSTWRELIQTWREHSNTPKSSWFLLLSIVLLSKFSRPEPNVSLPVCIMIWVQTVPNSPAPIFFIVGKKFLNTDNAMFVLRSKCIVPVQLPTLTTFLRPYWLIPMVKMVLQRWNCLLWSSLF